MHKDRTCTDVVRWKNVGGRSESRQGNGEVQSLRSTLERAGSRVQWTESGTEVRHEGWARTTRRQRAERREQSAL
jgi:hypothetical protein